MDVTESTSDLPDDDMEGEVSSSTSQAIRQSVSDGTFEVGEPSSVIDEVVVNDLPDTSAVTEMWESVDDDGFIEQTEAQPSGVGNSNEDSEPFAAVAALADINAVSSESLDNLSQEVIPMPSIGDNNEIDFLEENILISTTTEMVVEFTSSDNDVIVEQSIEMSNSDIIEPEGGDGVNSAYSCPQSSSSADRISSPTAGPSNSTPSTSHEVIMSTSNPDSTTVESSSLFASPSSSQADVSTTDEISMVSTSNTNPAANIPSTTGSLAENSQNVEVVSSRSAHLQTSPISGNRSVCSSTSGKDPTPRSRHTDPASSSDLQSSAGPSQSPQSSNSTDSTSATDDIVDNSTLVKSKVDPVSSTKDAENKPSTSNQESLIDTTSRVSVTARQLSEAIENLVPSSSTVPSIEGNSNVSSEYTDSEDSSSGANQGPSASRPTEATASAGGSKVESSPSSSGIPRLAKSSAVPTSHELTSESASGSDNRVGQISAGPVQSQESKSPVKLNVKPNEIPIKEGSKSIVPTLSKSKEFTKLVTLPRKDGNVPKPVAKMSALDAIKAAYSSSMQEPKLDEDESDLPQSGPSKKTDTATSTTVPTKDSIAQEKDEKKEGDKVVGPKPTPKPVPQAQTPTVSREIHIDAQETLKLDVGNVDAPINTLETDSQIFQVCDNSNNTLDSVDGKLTEEMYVVEATGTAGFPSRTETDTVHPRFLRPVKKEPAPPAEQPAELPEKGKKPSLVRSIGHKISKIFSNIISPEPSTSVEENVSVPVIETSVDDPEPMEIESTSSDEVIAVGAPKTTATEPQEVNIVAEPKVKKLTLKLKRDTTSYETASTSAQISDVKVLSGNAGQETLVSSGTAEEPKVEKLTLKLNKDVKPEPSTSEATNSSNQPKLTLKLKKSPMTSRTLIESFTDVEMSGKQSEIVSSSAREEPKVGKLTLKLKKDPVTGTSEIVSEAVPEMSSIKQMQDKITMKLKKGLIVSEASTSESTADADLLLKQGKVVEEEKKVEKLTLKLKQADIIVDKVKPAADTMHPKKEEKHEKITLTLKKNPVTSELLVSDKQMSPEVSCKSFERPSKHDAEGIIVEGETRHEKLTLKLRKDPITSEIINLHDKSGSSASSESKPTEEKHEKLTLKLKKDPVTSELVSHQSVSKNLDCELVTTTEEPKVAKLTLKLKKDSVSSPDVDSDKRLPLPEVTSALGRTQCDSSKPEERVEKLRLTLKKDAATSEIIAEKILPRKESHVEMVAVETSKEEPKLVEKLTLKLKPVLPKAHEVTSDKDLEKVEIVKEQSKLDKITLRLTKDANTSEIIAEKLPKKQAPVQDVAAPVAIVLAPKTEAKLTEKSSAKLVPANPVAHSSDEVSITKSDPKETSKLDKITLKLTKDASTSELRAEKKISKQIEDIVIEPVSEMPKEEPKLVEKLTLKIKSHDEVVIDKSVTKSDTTKHASKESTSKLDKITLRLTKDASKRAEVFEAVKEVTGPGSPSLSEGKSQEPEKIKLTFKKDSAWSVQKTKIKHKDSENSQSSGKSDYDENSSDIVDLPAKRQKLEEESVGMKVDLVPQVEVKPAEASNWGKAILDTPDMKPRHPLEAQEIPAKPSNLQLKNLSELSITAVEPPTFTPDPQDGQSSKGSVDLMREMLAKIGTSATLSADLSITLATPSKTHPRRTVLKGTHNKNSDHSDDVQIIPVAEGSTTDPTCSEPNVAPADDVTIVTEVVAATSDGVEVKQEDVLSVPKKGRGRPRKQALVVTPTQMGAPQLGVDLVVTPVAAPDPAAEPEVPAVVKVEPVRPKRSCRGEETAPVVKPKKPRKPRVVGKRKKRGGWRGAGRKNVRAPPVPVADVKLEPVEAPSEEPSAELSVALPAALAAALPAALPAAPCAVQNFEEETRMSAESTSRCHTPARLLPVGAIDQANEESQGSIVSTGTNATSTPSQRNQKAGRMEIELAVHKEVTVEQIAEYQWPPDKNGEHFMIQEQISEYLKVKSFKRKYPDLTRRPVEMEERTFLTERGLVTESMCDLGLTAVSSAEVLDIMYSDFQEKYEEYRRYLREKQAKEFTNRQKAIQSSSTERKLDYKEKAVQSTADWNATFNRSRKDKRRCVFDLQSFTIHFPQCKRQRMEPHMTQVGHYPVSLIPGQYTDFYKSYTPAELRYFPLNTVLYGPLKPNERHVPGAAGGSDGSQSDSDDSSSSDDSSDSSSDGTQDSDDSESLPGDAATEPTEVVEGVKAEATDAVLCKVCSKDKNKEGNVEVLINCSQCTTSVHPSCLDLTLDMVPHIRRYDWQCTDCKTCILCKDPADEEKMLFCDMCDRGYHIYCVGLRRVPTGRWHCKECAVCGSCGALEPGGVTDTGTAMWQHEYKKGEKGARVYAQTLCLPCSKVL